MRRAWWSCVRLDGTLIERLALPAIGTADGFGGLREDTETFYQFSNFTTPGTTYRLDMKTRQSTLFRQPKLLFDPALYETKQVFATSKDGTRVPMFVSHKKGLALDGTAPTLLYGYGGFNIPLMPEFSPSHGDVDGDGWGVRPGQPAGRRGVWRGVARCRDAGEKTKRV